MSVATFFRGPPHDRAKPRPSLLRVVAAFVVMLASLELLSGCATGPDAARAAIQYTGDPVVDGEAEVAAAPLRDRVLWQDRLAAAALRQGKFGVAQATLDDAILTMGGVLANDSPDAIKARSMFHPEDTKTFIGEPYERVMTYYYRGLLYWRQGQPDNARACYRTGEIIASDPLNHRYESTWVLLDYLDGFATAKLGGDGSDAYARAQKHSHHHLPPYDPAANVLCFAEFGEGPAKYAAGEYGEQLRFRTPRSRTDSAALIVHGRTVHFPAYDNLDYQATTRGGRVMDYILGNKVVFKNTTDTIGNLALTGAAISAYQPRDHRNDDLTAGLALAGILGKVVSAATTPQADTRCWDNLPQYLSFGAFRLPPGRYPATVEFFSGGRLEPRFTQHFTLVVQDASADTVIFLSQLAQQAPADRGQIDANGGNTGVPGESQ